MWFPVLALLGMAIAIRAVFFANMPLAAEFLVTRAGHPVLNEVAQTIRFSSVTTSSLRLAIHGPRDGCEWALDEIEVLR